MLNPVNAALALLLSATMAAASAQGYPVKPVRLIIPLAAGGNLDIVTRSIAQKLTEALGQQVIVENRAGVNSVIGAEYVARSPADGYTLLMMSSTFLTAPLLSRNVPFDPLRDFTGVTLIAWLPQLMVVHPSLPSASVRACTLSSAAFERFAGATGSCSRSGPAGLSSLNVSGAQASIMCHCT